MVAVKHAVIQALMEYIQRRKQLQVLALFGTVDYVEAMTPKPSATWPAPLWPQSASPLAHLYTGPEFCSLPDALADLALFRHQIKLKPSPNMAMQLYLL